MIPSQRSTYRCWTRWKPCREGTGTKMTIAFLPWPTSIYFRPKVSMRAPGCNALLGPLPVLFRALHGHFDVMAIERNQRPHTHMAVRSTPLARPPSNIISSSPMLRRPAGDERTIVLPLAAGGTGCRAWFVDLRRWLCLFQRLHTSRAETNCRGRRATLRSAVLVSRS